MCPRATAIVVCGILAGLSPALVAANAASPRAGTGSPATADRQPAPVTDRKPPVILALPAEPTAESEPLMLRAQVADEGGVGEVRLLAMGERDHEFSAISMVLEHDDVYAAVVPRTAGRGTAVRWMVEATDRLGNGPRRAGDPDAPYLATLLVPEPPVGAGEKGLLAGLIAGLVFAAVVPVAAVWRLQARDKAAVRLAREQAFWFEHVAPILSLEGAALSQAVSALCSRDLIHPERGPFRPSRPEVVRGLETCRRLDLGEFQERCRKFLGRTPETGAIALPPDTRLAKIEEDLFWLRLLTPLLDLPPGEIQPALSDLLARQHRHPILGPTKFARADVLPRLRWAHGVNPAELLSRYREIRSAERRLAGLGPDSGSRAQEVLS